MGCYTQIPNFEFAPEEIEEAVKNKRLLSLEIEFSRRCNFQCLFCYVPKNSVFENELTREEIKDVIRQAKQLGAKKIIILGGEPMLYPHILEMVRFIRKEHLSIEMFTNGSNITADAAKLLFDYGVNVVLGVNTFRQPLQDMLAGKKGAHEIIQRAFRNLKKAGYPSLKPFLAMSTIVCRENIDELIEMWQWMRDEQIVPYFEMITPQGNAKENTRLNVESSRIHDLFRRIAELDRKRYGFVWEPQPPLVGNKCLRHLFSCLVGSQGNVFPCVGVDIAVGNIRERRLEDIINQSEVIQDLRDYQRRIKGPCRKCEKLNTCYGCRGAAYQLTGDYLASDPSCWKNERRLNEIARLPVGVEQIIPQKSPMRVIDQLIKVGERSAEVTVNLTSKSLFLEENGLLDDTAYLEMIAQAIAAMNGFRQLARAGQPAEGFLLGAKKLKILGKARSGDTLKVKVYKYARYGDFGIVKGTVWRDKKLLAQGEIKVWHKEEK